MPTVLIVDDTAVDRRIAGGLLEKAPDISVAYAENGAKALKYIEESAPDLVVTDMQMPEMDGLELVRALNADYPSIPVILMTAYGSESIASQALSSGAASYVPKSELASMLLETAQEIIAMVRADRSYQRLIDRSMLSQFEFELDNDADLIDPLVDLVQQVAAGMGICEGAGRVRMGVALEHALLNALYRGNLELSHDQLQQHREDMLTSAARDLVAQRRNQAPFRDRMIFVQVRISREQADIVVRDQGKGFDTSLVPDRDDPDALRTSTGRGLVLMQTFMDEVRFNDRGNEVTMIKRKEN